MILEFTNAHLKKPSIKPQAQFWLIRVEVVHTLAIKGYNKYDYVSTDDTHLYNWFVPFQYRDTMTKKRRYTPIQAIASTCVLSSPKTVL